MAARPGADVEDPARARGRGRSGRACELALEREVLVGLDLEFDAVGAQRLDPARAAVAVVIEQRRGEGLRGRNAPRQGEVRPRLFIRTSGARSGDGRGGARGAEGARRRGKQQC